MHLYKYFPPERVDDVLKTFFVRFSQPSALNDPFDCIPAFVQGNLDKLVLGNFQKQSEPRILAEKNLARRRHLEREVKKQALAHTKLLRKKDPYWAETRAAQMWRELADVQLGVLSLSKRFDSLVMWAHYAKEHSGFVVEFDSTHTFFQRQPSDNEEIGVLQDVSYKPDRVQVDVDTMISHKEILLRKSTDWSYEEEVRLIREFKTADQVIGSGSTAINLFTLPKTAISAVIVGMSADPTVETQIKALLKANPSTAHIKPYKAKLSRLSYLMERYELL